jgi:hypothetical protein
MIVSWIHDRTGLHEVETETAVKTLREAKRALSGLDDLHFLIWRTGGGEHANAERVARELEAVNAALKARKAVAAA